MLEPGDLVRFTTLGCVYRHIKEIPGFYGTGLLVEQTVVMLVLSGNCSDNEHYYAGARGQWHLVLSPAGVGWIFSDWVSRPG